MLGYRTISLALVALALLCSGHGAAASAEHRERVLGIGGLFFKAENPAQLAQWYEDHLGIPKTPTSYDVEPWKQEAGHTVFAPFNERTTYFGEDERRWMVNFRVRDLDAMVAQLREAGIAVEVEETVYPNGRFARLVDPEGNPIQLWEPM